VTRPVLRRATGKLHESAQSFQLSILMQGPARASRETEPAGCHSPFVNGVSQIMSQQSPTGVLVVSVDVDAADVRGDLNLQRALNSTSVALLGVLANHGVAGTWAMSDPAHSLMTDRLLSDPLPHELALLGEASWTAPTMGRARFSRELAERVQQAAQRGVKLGTLAVRETAAPHYDLLVRAGMSVLRSTAPDARRANWWPTGMRMAAPSSAAQGGLITWVLDGPKLVEGGASFLRMVDRVLAYAERRRHEGRLQTSTLQAFVDGQLRRRESFPSNSILRSEAA